MCLFYLLLSLGSLLIDPPLHSFPDSQSIKAMSFFYVKYRYHLSIYEYTLIMGVSSIFMLFVLLIVPAFSRWMGERRVLQLSLLLGAVGFTICGVAWNVYIFCVGLFFSTFLGMANPTHLSIFSKNVTDRVQVSPFPIPQNVIPSTHSSINECMQAHTQAIDAVVFHRPRHNLG
jgi:MFS family permease